MEQYILILTVVLILYYVFRPISKHEKKNLENKNNWLSGF